LAEAAKFLILLHLLIWGITERAQNIANARLTGKIFQDKELTVLTVRCLPAELVLRL
jgi:hypothetical protein